MLAWPGLSASDAPAMSHACLAWPAAAHVWARWQTCLSWRPRAGHVSLRHALAWLSLAVAVAAQDRQQCRMLWPWRRRCICRPCCQHCCPWRRVAAVNDCRPAQCHARCRMSCISVRRQPPVLARLHRARRRVFQASRRRGLRDALLALQSGAIRVHPCSETCLRFLRRRRVQVSPCLSRRAGVYQSMFRPRLINQRNRRERARETRLRLCAHSFTSDQLCDSQL